MKQPLVGHGPVAALRLVAGLSQLDTARACDCTAETIRNIEQGRHSPSVGLALRLAQAYGVGMGDLTAALDRVHKRKGRKAMRDLTTRRAKKT
mgnify:CR=1 FL=1